MSGLGGVGHGNPVILPIKAALPAEPHPALSLTPLLERPAPPHAIAGAGVPSS